MSCNCNKPIQCGCDFNIKTVGTCDVSKLSIDGSNMSYLNWTEISVPEILCIPRQKPDIEAINQVYANATLDCVKLIETPFAYKSYMLYSFYLSVQGLSTSLPSLIQNLNKAVVNIITPELDTNIPNTLSKLLTALQALTVVPGVLNLIESVKGYQILVAKLVSDLKSSIAAVDTAAANLLSTLAIVPISAELICTAIESLTDSLNKLALLVNSIVPTLNSMIADLTQQANLTKNDKVIELVKGATDALSKSVSTLTPLTTSAINAINAILSILSAINCERAYAFTLINNEEGTCLSGRKLVIEGTIHQKVVYTAEVAVQSVHSAHYEMPFLTFIIAYPKFEGLTYGESIKVYDPITNSPITISGYVYDINEGITVDLCEEFDVSECIEDIYTYALDKRKVFKNVTLFLKAKPLPTCN
ncbi:MAG: hypothetical protein ACRC3Y_03175 [Romboutsia sp.]|uniref:hypothetical protein n=1 Tax=Romboutsia sp. TaxID=1965302 RepID=UPI003F35D7DC